MFGSLQPMYCAVLSHLIVSNSLWPHGLYPSRLLCLWGFSQKEYSIHFPNHCCSTSHKVFTCSPGLSNKVVFKQAHFLRPLSLQLDPKPCFSSGIPQTLRVTQQHAKGYTTPQPTGMFSWSSVWTDGHLKPDFYIKSVVFLEIQYQIGKNFLNESNKTRGP